ncbi:MULTISPECIES: ABC transporter ATP-binding protein [Bradyrhizobium]|uniref:Polysaccharide ABC transporter ATP-binding protein n=1 Tax=Bradyrhizobium oligotrophicum S58 TaxID=1245469 RepID=M4Z274_9BRAD|nr:MULTISPECIES: ABC transporter ATP-binding protein [Bradyrhizobium]BAM86867.1 polysaccharide ABC transporter ATP-binding protein [Bradyrhizobium oligotrophicum S58]
MSDKDWTVRAESVSKKFGLSLRRSMAHGLRDGLGRLVGAGSDSSLLRDGEFWAVKDISFTLERGQSLGIMGVNGCGKTTLLRILTGIYKPDAGRVMLRGRVGALIAAGAGFSPMLTGRENIYINAALLGLSPREIRSHMDEIVAFSELEQFIDMPVKHYSSGMQVRLGFAVAAVSEPEVLLVDEVLAVGDLNFQKKCYDYLFGLKRKGTSIVLVSHSIGAIWAVCDRGLFMDKGEVKVLGEIERVIRAYDDQNARNAARTRESALPGPGGASELISGTGDVVCDNIKIVAKDGNAAKKELHFKEPFDIVMDVTVHSAIDDLVIRAVLDAAHYRNICTIDSHEQGLLVGRVMPGRYSLRISVPAQNLRPGSYDLNIAAITRHAGLHLFLALKCGNVVVLNPSDKFLYSDPNAVVHFDADFHLDQVSS